MGNKPRGSRLSRIRQKVGQHLAGISRAIEGVREPCETQGVIAETERREEKARLNESDHAEIEGSKGIAHAIRTASVFILPGLVFIFVAIFCKPDETKNIPLHGAEKLIPVAWSLLEKIGEALIVVGLIDVIIHLPDWNKYFLDNLKSSLIDDSYLKRLDQDTLRSLAKRILVASFRDKATAMVSRGGFFDFFFDDIRALMAVPFREGIVCEYKCEEAGDDHFLIYDNLTYICREVSPGGGIQKNVRWTNEPGEISELITIKVDLISSKGTHNLYTANGDEFKAQFPKGDLDKEIAGSHRVDGLLVSIVSSYKVKRNMFQYWTMTHLSRDLSITFHCPPQHKVHVTYFGIKEDNIVPTIIGNGLTVRHASWILPNVGIAWKFIKEG